MILEINALDCLFFRNGRSFNSGSDSWADGIFPPPPSVIYGALRTLYFSENPGELVNAGKEELDPTNKLEIIKIWFRVDNTDLLPAPLDIVEKKGKDVQQIWREKRKGQYEGVVMQLLDTKTLKGNFKTDFVPYYQEAVENFSDALISPVAYSRYLKGEAQAISCRKVSDLITEEPKIGIARDNKTHTATEGHLYRVGMLRLSENYSKSKSPKKFKILVEIKELDVVPGLSRLGAEGKVVQFKKVPQPPSFAPLLSDSPYFRITLNTPSIFIKSKDSPTSTDWNPNRFFEEKGIKVKLLAATVGKEQRLGGWDIVKHKPKVMYSAVPAGSTYYYKAEANTSREIHEQIKDAPSLSNQRAKEGFGLYQFSSVNFEKLLTKL